MIKNGSKVFIESKDEEGIVIGSICTPLEYNIKYLIKLNSKELIWCNKKELELIKNEEST